MKDLDHFEREIEKRFGIASGYFIFCLHELSTAAGSQWNYSDHSTMDIVVTKENADCIYHLCKQIRSGYSVGLSKEGVNKVKEARRIAHEFLFAEANDPDTPIERKIQLVRLTGKEQRL